MAKHNLPRRGTIPANALVALYAAGTSVFPATLAARAGWTRGRVQFEEEVIGALCGAGLARIGHKGIEITRDGQRFVEGGDKSAESKYQGIPAAPRTAIVQRPLRSRSPMVLRPGAMDYRDIPSVMGGARYDFRTGAPLADA